VCWSGFKRAAAGFCLAVVALAGLQACATPAQRADRLAAEQGCRRVVVTGKGFSHVAYIKGKPDPAQTLHVYLEGDGSPRLGGRAARYPTSRNPLMLKLMALDPAPGVYLGRPCYLGQQQSENCATKWWTSHRYSTRVVDSMTAALLNLAGEQQPLMLLGHSGGGTLAMLMAERLPNVGTVVTVAGNLDPFAWTRLHGYPPLQGSLNPAERPPLPAAIRQLHLAGGRDRNVPAEFIRRVAAQQSNAEYRYLERYDHTCYWQEIWPKIVNELNEAHQSN
jgi:pimeloyl-ACP methyl ester carboxylesterase